jgi:large subunit ribosomal protein L4
MGLELKTKDVSGKAVGVLQLDESSLGGMVRNRLLHAAAVMYHANLRQGTHCTKTRAETAGSTKKLYKQKGTGRARAGNRKSGTRVGGGIIHGPKPRDYSWSMPQRQRQVAVRSALLGKAKDGELHAVQALDLTQIATKSMQGLLGAFGVAGTTVLVVTDGLKRNVYLSGRNIPGVTVVPAQELNARHILTHKNVLIDRAALERFNSPIAAVKRERKPKGTRKQKPAKAEK